MTVSWISWTNLFFICLSLCTNGAMSQEFQLQPLNLTVLQGSTAEFNATVHGIWTIMTWAVGGNLVETFFKNNNINSLSKQFSANFCSSADTDCVTFNIHNVTREQSGPVTCQVQGDYGSKTAQLTVQESGTVIITGGNVTVVQDQQVEFHCAISAWFPEPTVSWTLNGETVNSSLYNTISTNDSNYFNATSVLSVQAVRNTTVECWATISTLTNPLSSSVFLVVVPKPPDWTVLIAVVVSIGGCALLVLLILGIVFCYKRRKEKQPNYQDEMSRRVRTQSEISGVNASGERRGQINTVYEPDGQTSIAPTELTDSGFFQANGSNILRLPDVVDSNHTGNGAHITVDESGFMKHRHATIV